ncbi:hypothetical protein IEQ34_008661 [Dendrobium chrysotoxum]|uniref:Uncharacterized protein n=1 Tax=Dendrobium chrysotoxum TaxID=161865 RepID=A0AAV7GWI1_DENCH|nr:hypothetical protein IEQ34_008661 [Dendrobium chrysotoxum]
MAVQDSTRSSSEVKSGDDGEDLSIFHAENLQNNMKSIYYRSLGGDPLPRSSWVMRGLSVPATRIFPCPLLRRRRRHHLASGDVIWYQSQPTLLTLYPDNSSGGEAEDPGGEVLKG